MINLKTLLTELIVKDLTTGKGGGNDYKYIIVYRSHLFLLDRESDVEPVKDVLGKHPNAEYILGAQDINDIITNAAEACADILVASWYPDNKGLVVWSNKEIIPITSLNVKKVVKQLGIETVTYRYGDNDEEMDIPSRKLLGGIPKKMFHGTASDQLRTILKFGLDPGRGPSRFAHRGIEHTEYVFLAATFQTCEFYANHAVRISKNTSDNYPLILELEVPDPKLLVPDYDADTSASGNNFYPYGKKKKEASMKSMGLSRETGKWGYKGRIPSKFIKWVYYYNTYQKKWHKSRPDVWQKLLDRYDWETIGYKLGTINMEKEPYNPYGKPTYW